jgi:tripartite-type tricarboxylate transporter receptor subunit TctC
VSSVPSVQSQVAAGRLRVLAVTGAKRSGIFPNVPTVAETLPKFEAVTWFGILAPAGTPKPVIAKLNTEINKALKDPEVRKAIEKEGGEVIGGTPEQFAELIKTEIAAWGAVVKSSGAKVD